MKRTNDKIKAAIVMIAVAALIVTAVGVYALTTWNETVTWTLSAASFQVNGNAETGLTIALGLISTPTITRTYTITNNGNIPIIVNASVLVSGATATLNAPATPELAIGGQFTITLTLSAFTSDGSYTVTFTKA